LRSSLRSRRRCCPSVRPFVRSELPKSDEGGDAAWSRQQQERAGAHGIEGGAHGPRRQQQQEAEAIDDEGLLLSRQK